MGVHVLYLAGVPASGKSTIFKALRAQFLEGASAFKEGKVRGIRKGNCSMLGVFDGSTFEGTDKLCMDVIADAIAYVERLRTKEKTHVVMIEGDRLFNARFLEAARAQVLIIDASPAVLQIRHQQRCDTQSPTFLQSRRTKLENIINKYKLPRLYNNTESEQSRIVAGIAALVERWLAEKE